MFSAKETKMHQSLIRETWHMTRAWKQKTEPVWESLDSSQQSLSFPAMLLDCVQSHDTCNMGAPSWVIAHELGTSTVWDILSVQLILVLGSWSLYFSITPVQEAGNRCWVSYQCILLLFSIWTCKSWGNCRRSFYCCNHACLVTLLWAFLYPTLTQDRRLLCRSSLLNCDLPLGSCACGALLLPWGRPASLWVSPESGTPL